MNAIYTPETRKEKLETVFALLLDDISLRDAVKSVGVTLKTFHEWIGKDREAGVRYAQALELRADLLVDDAKALADGDGDPAKVRNQVEIRKWMATKQNSKRYGERIDLNVAQTIDISSTLLEARARLRPVSYLQDISDAQPREFIGVSEHGAHDKQSLPVHLDVPKEGAEPDIFS